MRKPRLIISKCLNSEKCRYNGQIYDDKVISLLRKYVDLETVCPETGIGLKVPRNPIRIEKHDDKYKLIEPSSNMDYTSQMTEFAEEFLNNIEDVDGFVLKSRSPSCGIKDVKIYPKSQKCSISKKGQGVFGAKVVEKYSNIPIEDEGRLKNYNIRDEFLTKIFTINNLKCENSILDFHNKNSLLLKSYNEDIYDDLNSIVNKENMDDDDINIYKIKVYEILNSKRDKTRKIRLIKDCFRKYEAYLNEKEIDYFDDLLKLYEKEKMPFSSIMVALQIYAIRFDDKDLLNQTFFKPYPIELISITDSGKGRNL
ncbi:MAG: DUF1722 domain-containing protein [Intestinibacter bartlettii]|uniref:DUF523 and DUF1722 domain-containing protein n=1 Tax=Intestinibacter bartlettii TaxID=261299 RepID=UPI0026ED1F78|nr:DUF1722 domain-containing protein [Intestinibacter bartlettii]MDO5010185.1 DUF1722 domain-containing protein [Intestinibacter bartlettii]